MSVRATRALCLVSDEGGTAQGWTLVTGSVWTVAVVVRLVIGQDGSKLTLADDQQPVQTLAPDGADPPFGVSVPRRTAGDLDPRVGEHGVEGWSWLVRQDYHDV